MLTDTADADYFWDELLSLITSGKVIPIVGPGAVTFGKEDQLLYPWLATRLAEQLAVPPELLPTEPNLSEVVTAHRRAGDASNRLYFRLNSLLKSPALTPGPALDRLASIEPFRLFLSATFDPLLAAAVRRTRPNGATTVHSYSSRETCDLPSRPSRLEGSHIFHLLGRVSAAPEYVVSEDDAVEFALALQSHLPVMPFLAGALKDSSFLVIGLNFSVSAMSTLLRVAKQKPASELWSLSVVGSDASRTNSSSSPTGQVIFLGNRADDVLLFPASPAVFLVELERRWRERSSPNPEPAIASAHSWHRVPKWRLPGSHVVAPTPVDADSVSVAAVGLETTPIQNAPPAEGDIPDQSLIDQKIPIGAIFISYAVEDRDAALEIKRRLEEQGCVVWFDADQIYTGDDLVDSLEGAVMRQSCAFISLISSHTESARRGWFHLERNWAADQAKTFASNEPFYFPVVTSAALADNRRREPPRFRTSRAEVAPGGRITPAFAKHLRAIQRERASDFLPPES